MQLTPRSSRHQTGASLIEVMVSALIVAFGILAMIALQTNALKFNKTSEYRSVATLLANDLADRIRVNPEGAELGQYDLSGEYEALGEAPEPQPCPSSGCSSAQLAAQDLSEWRRALFFSLPASDARVSLNAASGTVDMWVAWLDPVDAAGVAPGANQAGECPDQFAAANANPSPRCLYFQVPLPARSPAAAPPTPPTPSGGSGAP